MKRFTAFLAVLMLCLTLTPAVASAETYRVAWSHYTGWEFWGLIESSGIMDKHAAANGVDIEIVLINDYVESMVQYTEGAFIGVTMTNMDALTLPAVGGVDSTALIVGDFSNGNDGAVIKGGDSVCDFAGREVNLMELTVSHYMLVRALEMECGLSEAAAKMRLVNTSDADIASVFATAGDEAAVVTWNPPLMTVRNERDANLVFDSSRIPGEIIDIMWVRTDAPDAVKRALVGAWYEMMAIVSAGDRAADDAIAALAAQAGGTEAEFRAQLRTTAMFYDSAEAAAFTASDALKETMRYVVDFSWDHGLYGEDAASKDFVGIQFSDGTVMGDRGNVKLRFDPSYMAANN